MQIFFDLAPFVSCFHEYVHLFQFYPEYISQHPFQVNIMKELPAGGHLYQPVIGNYIVS